MGYVSKLIKKTPNFIQRTFYSLVPLGIRYGKVYNEFERFLAESEFWPIQRLEEYQLISLHALLHHAYKNIPFYRDVFKRYGIKPSNILTVEDLQKLPILKKDEIIKNKEKLIARNLYNCIPKDRLTTLKTSGTSTGIALEYIADKSIYEKEKAFLERYYKNNGSTICYGKIIALRTYIPEIGGPVYKHDYEGNKLFLSAYHLSKQTLKEYVDIINSYKAPLILSYPSAAYSLALLLEESNLKLKYVKHIHTASEKLLDNWKKKIEEVICPVKDHYGLAEKVCFHHRCSKTDFYHDNLEYGVTEIIDGKIIATGFNNWLMPFIRYDTGDIAVKNNKHNCTCGSNLPLNIKEVLGRVDDTLITKDGRRLPPTNFLSLMDSVPGIKMYELTQHDFNYVELKLVVYDSFDKESGFRNLMNGLVRRIGICGIKIKLVDNIERSRETGKIRCIKTLIKEN